MLVTTLLTCLLVREPELPREVVETTPPMKSIRLALDGLKTLHQARKALLVSFLSGLGIGAVFPFLTIFVKTITNCSDSVAEAMPFFLVATTALLVMPWGWVVDKLGPRVVLLIALSLIASASCAGQPRSQTSAHRCAASRISTQPTLVKPTADWRRVCRASTFGTRRTQRASRVPRSCRGPRPVAAPR